MRGWCVTTPLISKCFRRIFDYLCLFFLSSLLQLYCCCFDFDLDFFYTQTRTHTLTEQNYWIWFFFSLLRAIKMCLHNFCISFQWRKYNFYFASVSFSFSYFFLFISQAIFCTWWPHRNSSLSKFNSQTHYFRLVIAIQWKFIHNSSFYFITYYYFLCSLTLCVALHLLYEYTHQKRRKKNFLLLPCFFFFTLLCVCFFFSSFTCFFFLEIWRLDFYFVRLWACNLLGFFTLVDCCDDAAVKIVHSDEIRQSRW